MITSIGKKPKTEPIRERSIYVYLPSKQMVDQWKEMAGQAGMSISKFVTEHVTNSLQQERDQEGYISRTQLLDEMRTLNEENKELRKKIKMLNTLVDRLEEEVRSYRIKPFLEDCIPHRKGIQHLLLGGNNHPIRFGLCHKHIE